MRTKSPINPNSQPRSLAGMFTAAGIPLLPLTEVPAETVERIRILKGLLAMGRANLLRAIHCGDLERSRGVFLELSIGASQFVKWDQATRLVAEFEQTGRKPVTMETAFVVRKVKARG